MTTQKTDRMLSSSGTLVRQLGQFFVNLVDTLLLTETSPSPCSGAISTYEIVKNIRSAVAVYGSLKSIRLYWDFSNHPFPSTIMRHRSEFSASGVNLIDCPAEGRKGAAIKKMLSR